MRDSIFDVETTGVTDPEVIEVAWLDLDCHPDDVERCQVSRWKPSKPIELGALATHGILPQYLELCPPSSAFKLPAMVEYLIGFAIDYDWNAIGSPPNVKRIDLCAICRTLYPGLD